MIEDQSPPREEISAERIRYLGDLQRLELKPGEHLVLTVDAPLSQHCCQRLRDNLESLLPGIGCKVIILERGMTLGVMSCPEH